MNGEDLWVAGYLYTKGTLGKVPTGQLPGSGRGEQSVTSIHLDIDNKTRSICIVDERGGRVGRKKESERETTSRGLLRGYMYRVRSWKSRFTVDW